MAMSNQHAREVVSGERFEFGKNWRRFLGSLTEERIGEAQNSLVDSLGWSSLQGKRFLDIGSGSGLFSLAARRLGAQVRSFDYDPESVACTRELRRRYFPDGKDWIVEAGSVLDEQYLSTLGQFDVVYSWGVLHHTGQMWQALANVVPLVSEGGRLLISIYNDQGAVSRRWGWVKRTYNRLPRLCRFPVLCAFFLGLYWRPLLKDVLLLRPFRFIRSYGKTRGMTIWRDLADWIGGYPFEVAKPEQIFDFYRERGFTLTRLRTCNDLGCNEFVFERTATAPPRASLRSGPAG